MDLKPVPAFYCCYLLRSTVRHASLYIGSSPDPARRLAQHNGRVQGGAARTSRPSLRPWEMACIVAGFPSNIAALQFEWAWQNAHLTRHITADERLSFPVALTKTSARTGRTTRRPGRPRGTLMDKLSNLHLLLRVPYFSRWPLELRFFSPDAYRSWVTWCGRVDADLRPGLRVCFDPPHAPGGDDDEFTSAQPVQRRRKADLIGRGGVDGVDPTYARLRPVLEKGEFLLDEEDELQCSVCHAPIRPRDHLFLVCPTPACDGLAHVTCAADRSLHGAGAPSASAIPEHGAAIPAHGDCAVCHQQHPWPELMQQVTLRTRGIKEVQKLLKKKGKTTDVAAAEMLDADSDDEQGVAGAEYEDEDEDELTAAQVVDEEGDLDGLHEEDYDDLDVDDDRSSVASADSFFSRTFSGDVTTKSVGGPAARLEIVIEDSEDE